MHGTVLVDVMAILLQLTPPDRYTFCARCEHAKGWPRFLAVKFLNPSSRLLDAGGSRRHSCFDWFVGHAFIGPSGDGRRQGRLLQMDIGGHGESYPAIVELASDLEPDAEIFVLRISAPVST